MAARRSGLGRGLDSLIPGNSSKTAAPVKKEGEAVKKTTAAGAKAKAKPAAKAESKKKAEAARKRKW